MELDKQGSLSNRMIDPSHLKRSQYTLSLLQEGQRLGLISQQKVYQIQVELIQVLQQLIQRHTQGESTSVTSDTAEGIMTSLMYAVDACTLQFSNPEKAIMYLNKESIQGIHAEGVELLRHYMEDTKRLYQEVKKMKLDVPVDAYNMTIDESLPLFIKHYNIIFEAQNTMASIDYPLAIDDMQLQGVFYMKQYVERLQMETRFCHFFSHQDLMYVLTNFGKINRCNYQIDLFNIFELMLNNTVFSILSGKTANNVRISDIQFKHLNRKLMACSADQRTKWVDKAIDQLQESLQTEQALTSYIDLYRPELIERVNNTAKIGSFETLIIRDIQANEQTLEFKLHENDRMSDLQMRKLVDRLLESDDIEEKIQLLKKSVDSLPDYLDLLHTGCLFGSEYHALFDTFGNIELAILAKIVFYENLREGNRQFADMVADDMETEHEWELCYIEFMQKLDNQRLQTIGQLIAEMNYEYISFY
ncbi:DUF6179 domain-containing protein [Gracilibacillus alcaliphilus]|uniref:DUF6179 domain-containing protein n=1 Tax=Gracilibacillus alcaliphilus TaxID=1401441 RepID=UPI00195E7950|nr:DUF6179 domain-containing protein [Gracilibacillus alcaliphilus]MBM7676600.1 hypothetical protein [Gracilibacillus alcaliphilus]